MWGNPLNIAWNVTIIVLCSTFYVILFAGQSARREGRWRRRLWWIPIGIMGLQVAGFILPVGTVALFLMYWYRERRCPRIDAGPG